MGAGEARWCPRATWAARLGGRTIVTALSGGDYVKVGIRGVNAFHCISYIV